MFGLYKLVILFGNGPTTESSCLNIVHLQLHINFLCGQYYFLITDIKIKMLYDKEYGIFSVRIVNESYRVFNI